jgi:hypothetical protein
MVTEMTRAAAASIQQSQFNDFLFAPIGNEKNGMLLTVLSALARLDVDPWREAASMAQMSTEAATDRMTSLITALPEKPSTVLDPEAIAARLIALLPPRQVIFNPAPSKALARAGAANNYRLIIFVALMTFMLTAQIFIGTRQAPTQADSVHSPVSNMASPPSSTP